MSADDHKKQEERLVGVLALLFLNKYYIYQPKKIIIFEKYYCYTKENTFKMFAADDEDGDFLSPTGGAKLASLFGLDQAPSQGNESFQYTAPKQPRKTLNPGPPAQKPTGPPGAPAVLLATAIHAFKYLNGQYQKQGKLGAAVLGNHTTKEYKLLLYASQQKQVTAATIHVGFVFTVQPSNYCTFYDDQRQNWSLMFDTDKAAVDFCKEVCLAKVNSAPSLDMVVVQDLTLGEGQGVENGDSLEVAYTGWLLQNHAIGQVFDSNLNKDKLLRLKLGAGKVMKGWEEGMLGMRKSGRRLVVIPPSLGDGSQGVANCVPADSTLIFEAELRRLKLAKDSVSDRASAGSRDSAAPSPAPSMENLGPDLPAGPAQPPSTSPGRPGEPLLRAKSNSISEQLTNPDATKAKLISRMAKMGQPMLPFMAGPSSQPDSSDSEMEDPSVSRLKERPAAPSPVQISPAPQAPVQVLSYPHGAPPSALMPVAMTTAAPQPVMPGSAHAFQPYAYPQSSMAPSQLQQMGQIYPTQTVPYMGGTGEVTSFLMTEARQHNTEIRLAVGKVADKVDQLASKVDDLQRQGGHSLAMPSVNMETSMIMHNIQRIIQENESLKKDVYEKSSRVEEQNHKIGELINQNQRYMEQSNLLMEQRNDSLKSSSEHNQVRVLQAEQDKVRLTEELATCTARVSQLQQEATSHQQRAAELQSKLTSALQDSDTHCTRISSLETQLEEIKETSERGQAQYRTEKQKRKEMELRVNNMEEELQDLKIDKESLERTLSDRKRKWQAERQRCDEEMEELRRSSQQDMDSLKTQLRKARTSTGQAASEQLAQLQAELEEEWKGKCEQALASAKEQQGRQMAELVEQRDTLEQRLTQLQEKFSALKQSRDSEEQGLLQQQVQDEKLQVLQEKYSGLEEQSSAMKQKLEGRVAELERRLAEQMGQEDTAGEVKRVMNGVFHSLRGEFDLHETYTGSAVLSIIVNTIKSVTLQLLNVTERPSSQRSEEEEVVEVSDVELREERPPQDVHVNGEEEEEQPSEAVGQREGDPRDVQERARLEAEPETEKPTKVELASDIHTEPEQQSHSTQPRPTSPEPLGENTTKASEPTDINPEENLPSEMGQECQLERDVITPEVKKVSVTIEGPMGELEITSPKATGPPTQPPPPPSPLHDSPVKVSLTEGVGEENGKETFFQSTAPTKPPPPPTEEEEDDELSLKGRPPPAPLFGDEEDEDLDWLG
ncbi:FK506-binding protein 15-like isoform X3 [Oncorhynchus nerka]|uniref:FK506-binding protein 15-like isoform X3 n=1 Tax=Oncorhynchus nerka TaxID=8023 RepID=UPI0011320CB4|nr:FK506-binding protein 15-like isoform X3 [Oncorhynchus nerka]